MPKVSVIIPVYGVEKYLKECLDSVINQTLQDIEIICIDDGGKDNCPTILDEYAKKDNRIKVIHKENGGYGHSMNVGLNNATGEYIGIVEPDDYINPNMYEDLYNLAVSNNVDIVKSCFYKKIDNPLKQKSYKMKWSTTCEIPTVPFELKECPYFLYWHPSVWSAIYKNSFIKNNDIKFVEAPGAGWTDNPFQVQTMCLATKILYTDEAYYYWRCVNLKESDDLKDYTLPFKRSDEIHDWLDSNNINDPNILEALYMRELAYIHIVMDMKKSNIDNKDLKHRIMAMCARMDSKIIENSNNISKIDKVFYSNCKKSPKLAYIIFCLHFIRKDFFSIRLNSHEKSIKLLGVKIFFKKPIVKDEEE